MGLYVIFPLEVYFYCVSILQAMEAGCLRPTGLNLQRQTHPQKTKTYGCSISKVTHSSASRCPSCIQMSWSSCWNDCRVITQQLCHHGTPSRIMPVFLHVMVAPGSHGCINPLCAKYFRGNINIYLYFMSFLHIDLTQVLKILPQVREGPVHSI